MKYFSQAHQAMAEALANAELAEQRFYGVIWVFRRSSQRKNPHRLQLQSFFVPLEWKNEWGHPSKHSMSVVADAVMEKLPTKEALEKISVREGTLTEGRLYVHYPNVKIEQQGIEQISPIHYPSPRPAPLANPRKA